MINAGLIGVTGYAGEELLSILLKHPQVRISDLSAKIDKEQSIAALFPKFKNRLELVCHNPDLNKTSSSCDLVFLALPHTVSMNFVPGLLKKGVKVIDLSADYRFSDVKVYEKFYGVKHNDRANLAKAVYGLPELYRIKIKKADFIANPGCYPTASILGLAPLAAFDLVERDSIIIDAKSGVTGAGRKIAEGFLFSEINEDFKAYKVGVHQHAPEIDQEISKLAGKNAKTTFVPHLLPLNRGILATIYANKSKKAKNKNIIDIYKKFYKSEPFVRVKEAADYPRVKDVVFTNFCDIGIKEDEDKVIVISAIDNLLKGASGQAVQNMNIMCDYPETMGLV